VMRAVSEREKVGAQTGGAPPRIRPTSSSRDPPAHRGGLVMRILVCRRRVRAATVREAAVIVSAELSATTSPWTRDLRSRYRSRRSDPDCRLRTIPTDGAFSLYEEGKSRTSASSTAYVVPASRLIRADEARGRHVSNPPIAAEGRATASAPLDVSKSSTRDQRAPPPARGRGRLRPHQGTPFQQRGARNGERRPSYSGRVVDNRACSSNNKSRDDRFLNAVPTDSASCATLAGANDGSVVDDLRPCDRP